MAAVFPPTVRGMLSLSAVLKPTPKRGRGPDGGEASRDGDDEKQKMVPCSVCGLGDQMMEMFGLKRCAGCEASEESSQATTLHLPSNSEIDLAAESEMEDEQVKTGEGKGKGSAMAIRSRSRTPTSQRSPPPSPAHLRMMATLIEVGASDLAAAWIVADRSLRRRFFVASEARGSVGREMRRAAALGVK